MVAGVAHHQNYIENQDFPPISEEFQSGICPGSHWARGWASQAF